MGIYRRKNVDGTKSDYYIDYYVHGRREREKIGSSKKLAETVLKKRKIQIAEGRHLDIKKQKRIRFNEFADDYDKLHCMNQKSYKKTHAVHMKVLRAYFGNKYLDEVTVMAVEKFKTTRMKTVSYATVNRALSCLKSLFNKAIAWDKFHGENPVSKVGMLRENNKRLRYLEKEEISRLISNCRGHIKPIVIVAVNTGMRLGEILGLKWHDIDFKRDIIYLYETKNGDKREIPMNLVVKKTLIARRKHPESAYVFYKKDGTRMIAVRKSFFTALKKSGIKDLRFHDLRHTFASQLVMAGIDLNTVRELLGHKSLDMTLRYSHLSPDHKRNAVDVLGGAINGKLAKNEPQPDTIWSQEGNTENLQKAVMV